FQAGEYEDGIPGNSSWAEGDWNCDGDFSTSDFVVAFIDGGYVTGAGVQAMHVVSRSLDVDNDVQSQSDDETGQANVVEPVNQKRRQIEVQSVDRIFMQDVDSDVDHRDDAEFVFESED
ncbi:MAG: hypothetical protein KDB27_19015, partial [Planctomycetales bacterium]|nr:hypothetical protein [Planctomycetales bacterium]